MVGHGTSRLLVGAVICTCAAAVSAQDCPELAGSWPYGPPWAITVSGGYAYLSSGAAFTVADASDPTSLPVVGEVTLPDKAWHIAVAGGYAFVAMGPHGLRIIDVSLPSAPVEVAVVDTPGWAREVAVSGSFAYVADDGGTGGSNQAEGSTGLRVIDVSTPSMPVEVGVSTAPDHAWGVEVADGHAYVVDERAGLFVIDVSTPSAPRVVGRRGLQGEAVDLVLSGAYAYVAAGFGGLRVVDVSTPSSPFELSFHGISSCAKEIEVSGTTAYVMHDGFMSDEAGFQVIDIATPSTPVEVGRYGTPGYALDLALFSGHAYVTVEGTVKVVDVRVPASPAEVASHEMPGSTSGIAATGRYVYLAESSRGLRVIDMTIPSSPTEVTALELHGQRSALDVQISGSYAYVATPQGFSVVGLGTPQAPVEVGFADTLGIAPSISRVRVVGDHVYLCASVNDQVDKIGVFDVSTPSAPAEIAHWETPGFTDDFAVSEGYAYVFYSRGIWVEEAVTGLQVVDVREPSSPVEVGRFEKPWSGSSLVGVDVHEGRAYLAGRQWSNPDEAVSRLVVLDVNDPSSPVELGSKRVSGWIGAPAVSDGLVYVGASKKTRSDLLVFDVADPRYPRLVAAHRVRAGPSRISVADERVYGAAGSLGFDVFDVSACPGWVPPPRIRPRGRLRP